MTHQLKYKNIQVSYSDIGKGSVVVLLHGFLENSTMWNDIIPVIAKKNRVISIDLLGHGNTDCLGYIHTMEDQAFMIKHVLKSLKLRRYMIIGHSMGGYVTLAFADLFPKTIKGICLMNSTYETDDNERKKLRARANKMAHTNYENMVKLSFANLFAKESQVNYKTEIKKALKEALKTPLQGYIASNEGMRIRKDYTVFFKNATFKRTLILGNKDWIIDSEKINLFAKKHAISSTVLSEGHMSHIENKQELIKALVEFCK